MLGRRYDEKLPEAEARELGALRRVEAVDVVPLCVQVSKSGGCHRLYDSRKLDLLPFLTLAEQSSAVAKVGIIAALKRISGAKSVLIQTSMETLVDA